MLTMTVDAPPSPKPIAKKLLVGGVSPRGSLRREDHRHGVFTSGPAPDGRVKPDLVHLGRNVFCADASSTRSYGIPAIWTSG